MLLPSFSHFAFSNFLRVQCTLQIGTVGNGNRFVHKKNQGQKLLHGCVISPLESILLYLLFEQEMETFKIDFIPGKMYSLVDYWMQL